jgi:hypothetical protein
VGVHVQLEASVEVEVGPEQGGEATPVGVGEPLTPRGISQDGLDQDGVEVADRGLDEVE